MLIYSCIVNFVILFVCLLWWHTFTVICKILALHWKKFCLKKLVQNPQSQTDNIRIHLFTVGSESNLLNYSALKPEFNSYFASKSTVQPPKDKGWPSVFLYCKQLFSFKHAVIYCFGLEPEAISIQYPTRDFTYHQHTSSLKPREFKHPAELRKLLTICLFVFTYL